MNVIEAMREARKGNPVWRRAWGSQYNAPLVFRAPSEEADEDWNDIIDLETGEFERFCAKDITAKDWEICKSRHWKDEIRKWRERGRREP